MNDKQIKDEPYLVSTGVGDNGEMDRTRSLTSMSVGKKSKKMKRGLSIKLKE